MKKILVFLLIFGCSQRKPIDDALTLPPLENFEGEEALKLSGELALEDEGLTQIEVPQNQLDQTSIVVSEAAQRVLIYSAIGAAGGLASYFIVVSVSKHFKDRRHTQVASTKMEVAFVNEGRYKPDPQVPRQIQRALGSRYQVVYDSESKSKSGLLGEGSQGRVYLIEDTESKNLFVAKFAKENILKRVLRKIGIWPELSDRLHEDIAMANKLSGFTSQTIYVKVENDHIIKNYFRGKTLGDILNEEGEAFFTKHEFEAHRQNLREFFARGVAQGVLYQDVNYGNLIMGEKGEVILIDARPVSREFPSAQEALGELKSAINSERRSLKFWGHFTSATSTKKLKQLDTPQIEKIKSEWKTFFNGISMDDISAIRLRETNLIRLPPLLKPRH